MTALYLDGFDHYGVGGFGSNAMLNGAWAQVDSGAGPGVPAWGPGSGELSLHCTGSSAYYRYVLPNGALGRLFQSFRYSCDGLPSANFQNAICSFTDSGNNVWGILYCQADGSIALTDRSNNIVAVTQGPVLVSRSWAFLEMDVNIAAGDFTLRVNDADATGSPVISATGLTTLPVGPTPVNATVIGQIRFITQAGGTATIQWLDDLFIRDHNGTVNNSWLGDRRIATLFANADTSTSGWTPSYYHKFGQGILSMGNVIPNDNTVRSATAIVSTPAASSLDIGSADFTMESMVRFDKLPDSAGYTSIFSRWDATNNNRSYRLIYGGQGFNNGCLQFDTTTDGTSSTLATPILFPWQPDPNTWYHIAIVRAASEDLLFVNGEQFGIPVSDSRTYYSSGPEPFNVGCETFLVGGVLIEPVTGTTIAGRMDETRFTNGVGRYTGPFTPPSAPFTRGTGDADWTSVVLLMGYDSGVQDESSFLRSVGALNGAVSFVPADGPQLGVYTTVNKAVPDDNTFISASLLNATNIGTMTTQPSNGNTVTVGTTDGTTPAVYTFKTSVTTAFDVLIDTSAQNTLINLLNAINAGAGSGTKYGTGTTSNFDVTASQLVVGQIEVVANLAGTGGNSIPSTRTGTVFAWASSTLTGGANIPGPTDFLFQRPPNNTTIISALQTNIRALKTDAGTADVQTSFIAPLGGVTAGGTHALTVNATYYADIIETDADTSGPLTPTTIINGKFQIDRTA